LVESRKGFAEILGKEVGGGQLLIGCSYAAAVTWAVSAEHSQALPVLALKVDPAPAPEMVGFDLLDAVCCVVDREGKCSSDEVSTS